MGRFNKLQTLNYINENKVVPVFYNSDVDISINVMKSLHNGGIKILEFTNRGDFALEVFNELEKYCQKNLPDMILGAGSISDETMANMYISSGSNFIVGPLTNKNVAIACNRKKVPYMPGCLTPTEISEAEELGCDVVKVFPADSVGGPNFIKSVLAPMPWSWIMPTGGVDMEEEGLKKWLSSGVFSVGMGSNLFTKEIIQDKDWALLESQCKKLVETINKIK
ncbi:MAG: bifunctional 4-hydroxy-2-oxoglutarate aldolase/2-dehydro-3-deoxy-phosphogluconate aldolase [Chloroflexota bacterium]|mgnify:FL=1|nr:bifunctional 4-hydroxy-2-oxoglutarate aldolase/2-dehydro-3-deoxy-phosphogluconate aldolase [Chloroflexota bacterium]